MFKPLALRKLVMAALGNDCSALVSAMNMMLIALHYRLRRQVKPTLEGLSVAFNTSWLGTDGNVAGISHVSLRVG